jgi:hypothetical protein
MLYYQLKNTDLCPSHTEHSYFYEYTLNIAIAAELTPIRQQTPQSAITV